MQSRWCEIYLPKTKWTERISLLLQSRRKPFPVGKFKIAKSRFQRKMKVLALKYFDEGHIWKIWFGSLEFVLCLVAFYANECNRNFSHVVMIKISQYTNWTKHKKQNWRRKIREFHLDKFWYGFIWFSWLALWLLIFSGQGFTNKLYSFI